VDPLGEPAAGTVFVFPFDRPEVPAAVAVQEISAALGNIGVETLLFLRNIERVRSCGLVTADTVLGRRSAAAPSQVGGSGCPAGGRSAGATRSGSSGNGRLRDSASRISGWRSPSWCAPRLTPAG